MNPHVSERFPRISDAVDRLARGMWGGLRRPVPVQAIKRDFKKLSVGSGCWRMRSAQRLRAAAIEGELTVYSVVEPRVRSEHYAGTRPWSREVVPLAIPVDVLKQLIAPRSGLPDHPIRPSMRTACGDEKLFVLLTTGCLVVRESDFNSWYRLERAKGKWASQRSRSKVGSGRPTKQTDALRNAVLALVRDEKWSGKASITVLHGLLAKSGRPGVPDADTLARLVDQLHVEMGDPKLRRVKRVRQRQLVVPRRRVGSFY
jgi:hypothetical protein